MLQDEEYVKENGEEAETELRKVAENAFPIVVVVRLQEHLQNGKRATGKIKQYVSNAPTIRTLTLVVHVGLRNVFDDGDEQLQVR